MQKIHLVSGVVLLLIFLLSGQYLKATLPAFDGVIDGRRMMYRASHVYILMIALLHVAIGIYYQPFAQKLQRLLQHAGSFLLLLAAMLLLAAFAIEPAQQSVERSLTVSACVSALIGVGSMALAALFRRYR